MHLSTKSVFLPFVDAPLVISSFFNLSTVHDSKDALLASIAASVFGS